MFATQHSAPGFGCLCVCELCLSMCLSACSCALLCILPCWLVASQRGRLPVRPASSEAGSQRGRRLTEAVFSPQIRSAAQCSRAHTRLPTVVRPEPDPEPASQTQASNDSCCHGMAASPLPQPLPGCPAALCHGHSCPLPARVG